MADQGGKSGFPWPGHRGHDLVGASVEVSFLSSWARSALLGRADLDADDVEEERHILRSLD
jgi:hypothetical protein